MKLTANLPYLYSSNVYYSSGKWKDGLGYETKTKEFGVTAEVLPNLFVNVAQQKKRQHKSQDSGFDKLFDTHRERRQNEACDARW